MISKKQQFSDDQELITGSISTINSQAFIQRDIGIDMMNKEGIDAVHSPSGGALCSHGVSS